MTDGRGKLTRYSYTAFGNLKAVINSDNKTETYKYDLTGNTACVTDKNGNNIVFTYDNLGLLVERKVTQTGDSIKYAYDEAGNRISMQDESGTSNYSYDENNRLLEISKNNTVQIIYAYDQVGNVTKVTDLKGNTVAYTYDKSSRMETVSNGGKTTTYTYDENGRRKAIDYDGGVSEQYTYDKDNQLIQLTNKKPNGAIISEYNYTYDLAGRQLSKTDSYGTTNYEYDKAGRITKVTTPGKTTVYSYDKAGNRLSLNETYTSPQPSEYIDEATGKDIQYILKKSDYTYSNSNTLLKLVERMFNESNKEIARKTTKYVYDDNGNQLKQSVSHTLPDSTKLRPATTGTAYGDNVANSIDKLVEKTSYTYDGFNRLKKTETIKDSIRTTAEYTYNGDDLRVSKTLKKSSNNYTAEVTNYQYDRQNVILETDANNNIQARYIKGINYIAKLDNKNTTTYFLYNGHGDVVQTVDEAGTLQNQYDYDIWGNPTLTIETTSNAIRYAGEFLDNETGLYYLRARYYDPYIGRFISEDSYWGEDSNPLSLNLYTYCENDPIRHVDPSGHAIRSLFGGLGGAIESTIGRGTNSIGNSTRNAIQENNNSPKSANTTNNSNKNQSNIGALFGMIGLAGIVDNKNSNKSGEKNSSKKSAIDEQVYRERKEIIEYNEFNTPSNLYDSYQEYEWRDKLDRTLGDTRKNNGESNNHFEDIINKKYDKKDIDPGIEYKPNNGWGIDKGFYIPNNDILEPRDLDNHSQYQSLAGDVEIEKGKKTRFIDPNDLKQWLKDGWKIVISDEGTEKSSDGTFSLDTLMNYIEALERYAKDYLAGNDSCFDTNQLVMMFIRDGIYSGGMWEYVAGSNKNVSYKDFKKYVLDKAPYLGNAFGGNLPIILKDPKTGNRIDFTHLIATMNGITYNTIFHESGFEFIDKNTKDAENIVNALCGWAGDLQTVIGDLRKDSNYDENDPDKLYEIAYGYIGAKDKGSFSLEDMIADIDALNMSKAVGNGAYLSYYLREYYSNGVNNRYSSFISNSGGESGLYNMVEIVTQKDFHGITWPLYKGERANPTPNELLAIRRAFNNYIYTHRFE